MLLDIRRDDKVPIYRQVCDQVARLVDGGALEPGAHLPPSRVLAARLGLNRSTVCRAYEELWALGYLESRQGSYTTIRGRVKVVQDAAGSSSPRFRWAERLPETTRGIHDEFRRFARLAPRAGTADSISFAGLSADRNLSPVDDLRRAIRHVLLHGGRQLMDYGDPQGFPPLREMVARHMRTHGVAVRPEEVLITSGAQHALDLVLRLLTRPGDDIAVESPTYSAAIPLFRFHGLNLAGLPMLPAGVDLDALERLAAKRRPACVYSIPNFQNPTGITTSQPHRERLLGVCEAHGVPLIEDGFEEEMKYFGKAVLPIKSMDATGIVIYLGTFSKVIFPGLRVGWIVADRECIERLLAINRFAHLSGDQLAHAAVARFCEDGCYEQHLRRVHRTYRSRLTTMLQCLEQRLPARGVTWTRPAGGYTLWVELARAADGEPALLETLARHRVAVAPGSLFFPGRPTALGFRLSVSNVNEGEIEEGCRRLGAALRDHMR